MPGGLNILWHWEAKQSVERAIEVRVELESGG